jgi:hypothetical protein
MKKLLVGILVIALGFTLGYKKILPFIPESISSKVTQGLEKAMGKDPQKTVVMAFQDIAKKDYQKASENFLPSSRKFYNSNYLKGFYQQAGQAKLSRFEEKGNKAVVYFQTENNQSLMANLIKENGQWLIQDINDDPNVTID